MLIAFVFAACLAYGQTAAPPPSPSTATTAAHPDDTRTLLALPPLPKGKVSVVGGTVNKVDLVHDQLVIRVFGGKNLQLSVDPRSSVLQDNRPITLSQLRPGMSVSVDTLPNGRILFAKTVRVNTSSNLAEIRGQVAAYDASRQIAMIHDELYPSEVKVRVLPNTKFTRDGKVIERRTLRTGDLVHVVLANTQQPADAADTIEIVAEPGDRFTFSGTLAAIDLRMHTMTILNATDGAMHEVSIAPIDRETLRSLREGAEVSAETQFDGTRYVARTLSVRAGNP